jgi:hypothetical protein
MTQVTMESLEAGGFEGIIKEGSEAFGGDRAPRPCFVHHRDAGGWCERGATMEAFGIAFCEVHGAEVKAGVLAEIYHDACSVLEDAYGLEDSSMNPASWVHLDGGRREMARRCAEAEEEQAAALVRAYPMALERVDPETRARDYNKPNYDNDDPVDIFFDARMHTHRLMRLSWSVGEYWILEVLEEEREGASAQLAFALALRAQKTGQAV